MEYQLFNPSNEPFSGHLVYIISAGEENVGYTGSDGTIEIDSPVFELKIFSDNEYYAAGSQSNRMIQLFPVASISGYAVDDRENLIKNAMLRFRCSGTKYTEYPKSTDDIGFFYVERIGFGNCQVSIIKDDRIITHNININKSMQYPLEFHLTEEQPSMNPNYFFLFFGVIIIILLSILTFGMQKKTKRKQLTKTLKPKEEKIVLCIRNNNNSATQSQIRSQTNIPKSSLHRILSCLEQRNIIEIREYDGLKKYELTDVFRK